MRNYQPKKDNGYKLDKVLFKRMTFLVKDYGRMKIVISDTVNCSPVPQIPSPENQYSNPTLNKVIQMERISEECKAVEWALEQLPEEYQTIIFNKVCHDSAYPLHADYSTFSRWKCRFLYLIAEKLKYI